jgi:hypothetical protein
MNESASPSRAQSVRGSVKRLRQRFVKSLAGFDSAGKADRGKICRLLIGWAMQAPNETDIQRRLKLIEELANRLENLEEQRRRNAAGVRDQARRLATLLHELEHQLRLLSDQIDTDSPGKASFWTGINRTLEDPHGEIGLHCSRLGQAVVDCQASVDCIRQELLSFVKNHIPIEDQARELRDLIVN